MTIEKKILEVIEKDGISGVELASRLGKDETQVSRELRYMRTGKSLLTSTANKYLKVLNIKI